MGSQLKKLCTICARGGSKGLPNKNIRMLLGRPLIVHTINQAIESKMFAKIAVSSDSEEILEISKQANVDYLIQRPPELASDVSAKLPAIRHCAREVENLSGEKFEIFVDLDASSPLRSIEDITKSIKLIEDSGSNNLLTGTPSQRSPYFNMVEFNREKCLSLVKPLDTLLARRQDAPQCYDLNASIYIWTRYGLFERDSFFNKDTQIYIMPAERSRDIDSELDFKIVEFLAQERKVLV